MNNETLKLKPCPFCGDTAELYNDNVLRIECTGCWAMMFDGLNGGAEALAENWNTRVSE